ncbi:hypothetical protein EZV62_003831 [Acer yangbiense]|uniref:Uncharacterized protein n=1 Tax=Acer yangbiense TaxID=1000413 RepID=A0A5C7IKB2_9ROSI|nr:hypothetical protein EZV62_003831 [Acer yangbiense]
MDTSSGSGEPEPESSRDGGDDLGRLKKDRSSCDSERNHRWGECHSCPSVGTLKKFSEVKSGERHAEQRTWLPQKTEEVQPMQLQGSISRIDEFFQSSHVLCLNWIMAAMIAEGCDLGDPAPVVYVSGESINITRLIGAFLKVTTVVSFAKVWAIWNGADHMRIGAEELILYSSTDIELHVNLHACMDEECFISVALICLGAAYG